MKRQVSIRNYSELTVKAFRFWQWCKNRVEPLREWVKTAHHAGKMATLPMDLSDFKAFTEKVGSNRLLQDKKIVLDWLPPFDLLAKHKGLAAPHKKSSDKAELKKGEEKKNFPYGGLDRQNLEPLNPRPTSFI